MNARQSRRRAKDELFRVAVVYGRSMTELPAEDHIPKDAPLKMSLARAYVAYRRACSRVKP